jgi:hypothetical protein
MTRHSHRYTADLLREAIAELEILALPEYEAERVRSPQDAATTGIPH